MDDTIIGLWYKEYYQAMIGLAVRILGNKDDAEDVVQDVFLEALRSSVIVDDPRAYLFTAVSNRAKNVITRNRGRISNLGDRDVDVNSEGKISWYENGGKRTKDYEDFNAILDVPDSQRLSWYIENEDVA